MVLVLGDLFRVLFTIHKKSSYLIVGILCRTLFLAMICASIVACKEPRPDPVRIQDGVAHIEIDGVLFLIPENTWLKGYSLKKTDGLVGSIVMHATAPNVQPWSPERHEKMYRRAGLGEKILIHIWGGRESQVDAFPVAPQSIYRSSRFAEEVSDQAGQGLRRFRLIMDFDVSKEGFDKHRRDFGDESAERVIIQNGTPYSGSVFYELIEDGRVRYFVRCNDREGGPFKMCHLFFPWGESLMVDVLFERSNIGHIISMAYRVSERIGAFEVGRVEPLGEK